MSDRGDNQGVSGQNEHFPSMGGMDGGDGVRQQQGQYPTMSMGMGGDNSLPQSMPSYLPASSGSFMPTGPPMGAMGHGYDRLMEGMQPSNKKQAPFGQWKTPPQVMYSSRSASQPIAMPNNMKKVNSNPDFGRDPLGSMPQFPPNPSGSMYYDGTPSSAPNMPSYLAGPYPPGQGQAHNPQMMMGHMGMPPQFGMGMGQPVGMGMGMGPMGPPPPRMMPNMGQGSGTQHHPITFQTQPYGGAPQRVKLEPGTGLSGGGNGSSSKPRSRMKRSGASCPDLASLDGGSGAGSGAGKRMPPVLDAQLLAKMSEKLPQGMMGAEGDVASMKTIMSHPDLLALYQRLQEEDERRRRRLARNRASARLRRLRKKTMVEVYEADVACLERTMGLLKSHRWGAGGGRAALLLALGEEKQVVFLTRERQAHYTDRILAQHVEAVASAQRDWVDVTGMSLACGAGGGGAAAGGAAGSAAGAGAGVGAVVSGPSHASALPFGPVEGSGWEQELAAMGEELKAALRLSEEQDTKLSSIMESAAIESQNLAAIHKCLAALRLRAHEWLVFPAVDAVGDGFRSVLNAQQLQKFLSWTDQNRAAIGMLDYAAAAAAPPTTTTAGPGVAAGAAGGGSTTQISGAPSHPTTSGGGGGGVGGVSGVLVQPLQQQQQQRQQPAAAGMLSPGSQAQLELSMGAVAMTSPPLRPHPVPASYLTAAPVAPPPAAAAAAPGGQSSTTTAGGGGSAGPQFLFGGGMDDDDFS